MRLTFLMTSFLVIQTVANCGADEPKDQWITFVSHRSGKNLLYKMRPDGSETSAIFGGELKDVPGLSEGMTLYREPHWARQSADGQYFIDWAADFGLPLDKYNSPVRFMLFLGRLDGGPTRTLVPDGEECFAWSPDSKQIAFAVTAGNRDRNLVGGLASKLPSTKIFIVGVDGANEELVLEKPGIWNVCDWSPDGRRLLLGYLSDYSLAYSAASLHEFDMEAALKTKKEARAKDYTFSLIYPASQQINAHLKLLSGSTKMVDGRYSPDGTSIAVDFEPVRDAYNPRFELGLLNLSDLKLKPIHKAPGLRGPLCWSLDGKQILFSRWLDPADDEKEKMEGGRGLGIFSIGPDGGGVRLVTTGWSPDWR